MTTLAWHFTAEHLRDGRPIPPVGEWLEHDGPIVWCGNGLYASRRIIDALTYATGNIIHKVECEQIEHEGEDEFVCRRRRIIASIDGEQLLRKFAWQQALSVAHLWDMPFVVRQYLETGDEQLRAAARTAVGNAVRDAVIGTARAAAWDAARAAVRDAAWATVRDAVRGAVRATAMDADRAVGWAAADRMLTEMVEAKMREQA